MMFWIIFVLIPLAEISVFITVGDEIGLLSTLLLCLLTAMIGGFLVRLQGLETLIQGQRTLAEGHLPVDEIFSGFCLVVAGAMLITPGFVTDALGFSLLVPGVRSFLRRYLATRIEVMGQRPQERQKPHRNDDIVEGDFKRIDPADDK